MKFRKTLATAEAIFEQYVGLPCWLLFGIIIVAGVMSYLAYGLSVFDSISWFTYFPTFNIVATVVIKWVVTPALLLTGGLAFLVLVMVIRD